ncbi:MAG: hypothetical protein WCJ96_08340 [Verrucomicrobiota bacterium]|jgi:hypothetical protein
MDKSQLRLVLRFTLVALWAAVVLSIALSFVADKLLPDALADWHKSNGTEFGFGDILGLLFWVLGILLLLISSIGLFFYQRWAAWMFVVVNVIFSLQVLTSPTVEPGLLSYIGGWSDLLTGMVVAIAFFTDALKQDEPQPGFGSVGSA